MFVLDWSSGGFHASRTTRIHARLARPGGMRHFHVMSTLAEIEEVVAQLSAEELAELERFVRKARRGKDRETGVLTGSEAAESEFQSLEREEQELRAELRSRGMSLNPMHNLSRDELHTRHALR
jgi:hypothetical protein